MNRRLVYILLLIMSALLGWFFGFIKFPYIDVHDSFWLGFFGCLTGILLVTALIWLLNIKKTNPLFESTLHSKIGSTIHRIAIAKILISILFVNLLVLCIVGYSTNKKIKESLNHAQLDLAEWKHRESLEAQKNKISLLLDLIHTLDSTKMNIQNKSMVDKMTDRIVALSHAFKLHKEWDTETASYQYLSSERGMLLLALVNTQMDSTSFQKIKDNVSFSGANLKNVDLHGLNLNGIDLRYANLQYANLQATRLEHADLRGANLLGVNLNQASLYGTNLIATKLNWSKINEAKLNWTRLDSADMTNATLQKSTLNYATLIHTVLSNAILNEADVSNCFLFGANISNANLTNAIFTKSTLTNANLEGVILNGAITEQDWLEKLNKKNQIGAQTILDKYQIVSNTTIKKDSLIYRLMPKTN
ncbi:MAG: pentapeptide repeat-containing protein [Saprospiraceae bacterium]